jgi:hypothetical protein
MADGPTGLSVHEAAPDALIQAACQRHSKEIDHE